jgi:uncharacterized protein YbjT (DUF2867 family)
VKILITGATGTVGGLVASQLVGRGHELVALVRDTGRGHGKLPDVVELVEGDLTRREDVVDALNGVDRAFLNMADDNGAAFAAAAGETGLGGVALLSSFSTFIPLPNGDRNVVAARHRAGEKALRDAGVPSAFLRCAGFDYNILMWAADAASTGVIRAPYPDAKLPVLDPADIAASVVAVLTADPAITGTFVITGPDKLSVTDQAAVLSSVLGRSLKVERISEAEAAAIGFPEGTPELVTSSVLGTLGDMAAALEPTDGVLTLTGHAPRAFRDWANEHQEAFS